MIKIPRGEFDIKNLSPGDVQSRSYQFWLEDGHGDNEILYTWDSSLPFDGAIVVDVGGYTGEWSSKMLKKYPSIIRELVIYEAIPKFALQIREKFVEDTRVTVYENIASNGIGVKNIYFGDEGSSTNVKKSEEFYACETVDFGVHIQRHFRLWDLIRSPKIDLMKINIEGDEFDVIESLHRHDVIKHVKSFLIQTHPYRANPVKDYETMYEQLLPTHERVWNYPWIWEAWKLRS